MVEDLGITPEGFLRTYPSLKMELIWENAAPGSEMGSGVKLGRLLTSKDKLVVVKAYITSDRQDIVAYCTAPFYESVHESFYIGGYSGGNTIYRQIYIDEEVSTGNAFILGSSGIKNQYVVPLKVFVLKEI